MRKLWFSFEALEVEETLEEKTRKRMQKLVSGHVIQRADYLA